jgi:hypothetical protein
MLLTYKIGPSDIFTTESGPDIAPVVPDSFTGVWICGDVLKVTNTSIKAGAGGSALVTTKPKAVLPMNIFAMPYFGLDLEVYVSALDMPLLGRLEIDVKRCIAPGKVGNGSTEWNTETGDWRIDDAPPRWVPTGFKPLLSSTWTPLSFRFSMSPFVYSVCSTTWGGMHFDVPQGMQNKVLQDEPNWRPDIPIQLQTLILKAGVLTTYYRRMVLSLSDAPIP